MFIKIEKITLILLLTISSCNAEVTNVESKIRCNIEDDGSVIDLYVPKPHGGEFAILDPVGNYFFVAYKKIDYSSNLRPLISYDDFKELDSYKIVTATFKAHPWENGANEYRKVFNEKGTYEVIIGDNLESDNSYDTLRCNISY